MVTLFLSGSEIIIVLLVVIIVFGPKKIPEIARGLGKGLNEFRKATDEIKKEITKENPIEKEVKNEVNEMTSDINKVVDVTTRSRRRIISQAEQEINDVTDDK